MVPTLYTAAQLRQYRMEHQTARDLREDWIGKAIKFTSGGEWTMVGYDLGGNVLFKADCVGNDDLTVLIEDFIAETTTAYDASGNVATAVAAAGGFSVLAPKVARWGFDSVVGTMSLQSAPVVRGARGRFPHSHGAIVDYDLQAITSGDEIGIGRS